MDLTWLDVIDACSDTALGDRQSEVYLIGMNLKGNHSLDQVFIGTKYLLKRHNGLEI